jgi:hypothetical protein
MASVQRELRAVAVSGFSGMNLGAVFGTQSVMISRVRNAGRA